MPRPHSQVVYRGPSRFDPAETIRAVLVLRSRNRKTGDMAQLYVLHDNIPPTDAQATGHDSAVCGACPLRPANSGGCYVVTCQGPLSTWKATNGHAVSPWLETVEALKGRALRLGAYGDVAALPADLVRALASAVDLRITGYTHGHRLLGMDGVSHLSGLCMLSVESPAEARAAAAAGWRYFRTRPENSPTLAGEIQCPFERVECTNCLLCRGTASGPGVKSISVEVHGSRVSRALNVIQVER